MLSPSIASELLRAVDALLEVAEFARVWNTVQVGMVHNTMVTTAIMRRTVSTPSEGKLLESPRLHHVQKPGSA